MDGLNFQILTIQCYILLSFPKQMFYKLRVFCMNLKKNVLVYVIIKDMVDSIRLYNPLLVCFHLLGTDTEFNYLT